MSQPRSRRSYLTTAGCVLAVGLAGCSQQTYDGEPANEFGYETTETAGVEVPLVPIEDALGWHGDDAALFADARGSEAYESAHIAGAVHSPAPDGASGTDPVEQRETDTRVVTYCGCPHHLSTQRGASLIGAGYADTYAIDEGFGPWRQNGYPMNGSRVEQIPESYRIDGRTSAGGEDGYAWVWHDLSGQREAAPIESDGTFSVHVQFYDVGLETELRLSVPGGERTAPLAELATGEVVL